MYRILMSGYFGTEYIGISVPTESEAQELCKKYNAEADNPYIYYSYRKEA